MDTGRTSDTGGLHCLVTGATGYIGGRLVPELLAAGHRVRCLARTPEKLRDQPWAGRREVVRGDVTDADAVARGAARASTSPTTWCTPWAAAAGSRRPTAGRRGSSPSGRAPPACGASSTSAASTPPASRAGAVAAPALPRRGRPDPAGLAGCPTAVLRAAVIIGSGSASFEMLRYLTERLPVMVTPSWVRTRIQPIAVRDVLRYLVGCAAHAGRRQPGLRHRRPGRPHLPRR